MGGRAHNLEHSFQGIIGLVLGNFTNDFVVDLGNDRNTLFFDLQHVAANNISGSSLCDVFGQ